MQFLIRGRTRWTTSVVYDGHLLGVGGYGCHMVSDEAPFYGGPTPCDGHADDDPSRMMMISAQSDLEFLFRAALSRYPDAHNWRQYELARSTALAYGRLPGLPTNQNPATSGPCSVPRSTTSRCGRPKGIEPPPSQFIEGEIVSEGESQGNLITDVDEDGNALGGLRLPHYGARGRRQVAGAPLGTYTGLNPDVDLEAEPTSILVFIGGTFEPFSDEELESGTRTTRRT
jgi:hypothetical protein